MTLPRLVILHGLVLQCWRLSIIIAEMVSSVLSLDNVVMANYAFYATILVLKLFLMALLTSSKRFAKNVFATQEDYALLGVLGKKNDKPVTYSDPDVERVRKNHLNDLENIPAFLFLGLLFVLIGPNPSTALWHFRIFTISRFTHMVAYQLALPQPSRVSSYIVGLVVCVSMAVQILLRVSY